MTTPSKLAGDLKIVLDFLCLFLVLMGRLYVGRGIWDRWTHSFLVLNFFTLT